MADESIFDVPSPRLIVKELDKYIISQKEAKKSVAIALRNRGRRKLLPEDLRDEVAPKNIIMMGPTGVGKTEIARRLSNFAKAPFIKVEATKYTEIGYVGRDVEAMVRDLTNIAVNMCKSEMQKEVEDEAKKLAEERLLDLLFPLPEFYKKKIKSLNDNKNDNKNMSDTMNEEEKRKIDHFFESRKRLKERLLKGEFEEKYVELSTEERFFPAVEILGGMNMEDMDFMLPGISNMMPKKRKRKKMTVKEARKILILEEVEKLIDMDKVVSDALYKVENMGIIFIDEIDKIIGSNSKSGPDVSREGVQRDLLPIVEGTSVMTKYGVVKTHHILFIAAGAFHGTKPADLIPELQGRFPIRVELKSLTEKDFEEILTKPKNALTKQYVELLKTEGINLKFEDAAIEAIAKISFKVNNETEDIGARRLHTIMEKLLEDISFNAPDLKEKDIVIDDKYVYKKLKDISEDSDLSRYIL